MLSKEISRTLAFLGFLWWKNQFFQDGKQTPYGLAETCMKEPVSHGLMQKLWQLRPQVASNAHLVSLAVSGELMSISLKLRPLIYKHRAVLLTNYLITMPQATNIGGCAPEVERTIDSC